jgi:protein O-mannosyl-transferase
MRSSKNRATRHDREKNRAPAHRRQHWIAGAVLFVLALLAYSNSFQAGLVLDNDALILRDPRIHAATGENVALIIDHSYWWPFGEAMLYRPFTTLTYLFNYDILGNQERPAGYHWINFLLHFGNVLLVYLLGLKLMRDPGPASVLAGVWSVHPVLTESVTNIVGRADLLAGMAVVGGLLLYLKSAECVGSRRMLWLAGLFACSLIGTSSKESAAMLLGVVVLYELVWWRERRKLKELAFGCAAIVLPFFAFWAQRSAVLAASGPSDFPFIDNPLVGAGFWTARLTAVKVMARNLGLMAWPRQLSSDYSYRQIPLATGTPEDWICWLAIAAAAATVVLLYRRSRTAFFLACFAFITYLPTSNLLFPIGTIMAERFLYLPAIGVIGCVVLGVHAAARHYHALRPAAVAAGIVAVCLLGRTWIRNRDWLDGLSLANAMVMAAPSSYKSHSNRALALYQSDESRLDDALAELEKSLAILDPLPDAINSAETYMMAGDFYLRRGDRVNKAGGEHSTDAAASYRKALAALEHGDRIVQARNRLEQERARVNGTRAGLPVRFAALYRMFSAVCLRLNDAERSLKTALYTRELAPDDADTYRQLASSYFAVQNPDQGAIVLIEGIILTSNPLLKDDAIKVYRSGLDVEGCAAVRRENELSLNPSCGIVQRHICAASADAIQLLIRIGRQQQVAEIKKIFFDRSGCDAASLEIPKMGVGTP